MSETMMLFEGECCVPCVNDNHAFTMKHLGQPLSMLCFDTSLCGSSRSQYLSHKVDQDSQK